MIMAENKATTHQSLYSELGDTLFVTRFRSQLMAYSQGDPPFDRPWTKKGTLSWWRALRKDENASCLAVGILLRICSDSYMLPDASDSNPLYCAELHGR
jgi:hypothetical protein